VSDGPGRGTRDNGLRCGNYVPIADLDPRVADALLSTLRDEGIAAYAAPTPGTSVGYGERVLPPRPIDRLWVDDMQVGRAREIVDAESRPAPTVDEPDFDTAWQQVLASLQSPASGTVPPWPVSEDVDTGGGAVETHVIRPASLEDDDERVVEDDEHFVPPPAPPFPKFQPATVAAIASIVFGLFLLVTQWDGGSFNFLGIIAVLGGVATLIYRMRQGPPTDSGWDDGAVV
jgi:hypothetical protein